MRRYISIPAVLLLVVIVHVDWHLARGHHHRLSMEWHYHWIIGFAALAALFLFAARKWPKHFLGTAFLNAAIGLFLGQIIEPLLEALGYHVPVAAVFSPERWRVFCEFLIAGVAGSLFGVALVYISRRAASGHEPRA